MSDLTVANTIYKQMGGGKFKAMVGVSNLAGDKNSLRFNFKMCRKANICKITLTALDLYEIEFFKLNRRTWDCPKIDFFKNLYWDQLKSTFESFTGLRTSL
ncbi:hypothetical protein [Desulfospira joergensenii]|uniref:hypothetical protein n=1 Tax=Desulfospira joergensenii TaxID=53329 RepID=UPI0003B68956|nr:hypothetical protein [Desulfospira joergensenii]